ncbi:S53 family peptidase [Sulfolobus acidocaldarius]|uniref:Conserved protein n=4 Tax=Sulfolobus acidocaldarius TaxID=2285 RepID=Q4J9N4_SULAC|nr:protease pro-enzyme activation domain-containing protein [Sulfolobus acidocaldarius]AAY80496.1 conserved protein [Sulfolobus acidocaldarius DSM 639]AGE71082.1 hypothetical protein SacN8_05585 [Sulfolobus acidocaldarius N8]AGE73353.1 hypothetical protein SacRon12I_05575 [Sulfolobus acidocaldarius Ron12/I]ALU28638.1 hypothetical protein ATY89_00755 [Sulfolobus acidocaldarius]ALU31354.1 hypothetical protein ATZ20_03795 [Sulfolobus acidocaldarius]
MQVKFLIPISILLISISGILSLGISSPSNQNTFFNSYTNAKLLPSNTLLTLTFFIPPKNLNMLYYTAEEVANHQISPLTPQQIIKEFSQPNKVTSLINFLESNGFTIYYSSPFAVVATATAGKIDNVFSTELGLFSYNGHVYYKPLTSPSFSLTGIIVGGLDNETAFQPYFMQLNNTTHPAFQFSYLGYGPNALRTAYNVTGTGKNVTIAIIDAFGDPLIYQDVKSFDQIYGLPPANLSVYAVGPYIPEQGIATGWDIETALDVEAAHAMAPYAKINLVVSSDSGPTLYAAVDYVVTQKLGDVVSMSWGLSENLFAASGFYYFINGQPFPNYPYLDYYFALGTAEGITFFASSGDTGAYGDSLTTYGGASFPATSPFVTAVGGTTLYLSSGKAYETAWSVLPQYFEYAGTVSSGGGYSTFFPRPWYQDGVINSSFRAVPDVAADANPYTGFNITVLGSEEIIGGTSLASPLWAGMLADIISQLGRPIGLLNPILYWIYKNPALYQESFHQITLGYNGEFYAKPGYNLVTGLGTPNVGELLNAIQQYLKTNNLEISVTTNGTIPWYMYNSTVSVIAYITYPNGTIVSQGTFSAYIQTTSGTVTTIPLSFNGTDWVGSFNIQPGMTPNIWSIIVNGSSAGFSGTSSYDIDVGQSINILSPIPFPYGPPLSLNTPFGVVAQIYNPDGTPAVNQTVNVYLLKNGKVVESAVLTPTSQPGEYVGQLALITPAEQGTYILVVNTSYGSAYTYVYFGNIIEGAVYTPINTGFPGVSPGQNITLFAFTLTPEGTGQLSSNVSAFIYNQNGQLVSTVNLTQAPEITLFGVFNFFGLYYANFTIPSNFTPGFYSVIIQSQARTGIGVSTGEFFTSFYVSPASLSYNIKVKGIAYEGQHIKIYANITYTNGTEVEYGIFNAIPLPSSIAFKSYLVATNYSVPLQFNSTLGLWEGTFQIPSVLGANSFYLGYPPYTLSGPWTVYISGVSANGNPISSGPTYFNVLPYTYLGSKVIITSQNYTSVPLLSSNSLSNVYVGNLELINVNISLNNVVVGNLTVVNSQVGVSSSTLNSLTAKNSKLSIAQSTIGGDPDSVAIQLYNSSLILTSVVIANSTYAFNQVNSNVELNGVSLSNVQHVSTISPPTISPQFVNITQKISALNLTVSGYNAKILNVLVNGISTRYSVISSSQNSTTISIPFSSSALPSGQYTIVVMTYNGLPYNVSATVYNAYPQISLSSSLSNATTSLSSKISSNASDVAFYRNITIASLIIAIISLILVIYLLLRRR